MKPKESFDAQKFLEDIQAYPLTPTQIVFQLGAWLQVTTNLTQISNNGTITYIISATLGFSLIGDTVGQTNKSDPKLQLASEIFAVGVSVGNVSFLIRTDLGKQHSTADVTVSFNNGQEFQYSGVIAAWGK